MAVGNAVLMAKIGNKNAFIGSLATIEVGGIEYERPLPLMGEEGVAVLQAMLDDQFKIGGEDISALALEVTSCAVLHGASNVEETKNWMSSHGDEARSIRAKIEQNNSLNGKVAESNADKWAKKIGSTECYFVAKVDTTSLPNKEGIDNVKLKSGDGLDVSWPVYKDTKSGKSIISEYREPNSWNLDDFEAKGCSLLLTDKKDPDGNLVYEATRIFPFFTKDQNLAYILEISLGKKGLSTAETFQLSRAGVLGPAKCIAGVGKLLRMKDADAISKLSSDLIGGVCK